MRRSLLAMAAMTAPILAPVVLPATANSAPRASIAIIATVNSVSCAPGGSCAAGGQYRVSSHGERAFVLTELNGQWGTGIEVPGLEALHPRAASVRSVSCAPGGCVAGGFYLGPSSRYHAFVTVEQNGRWSRLVTVFTGRKGSIVPTMVGSLSCSGPRNCTAVGGQPAFVVSEVNGRWGRAREFSKGTRGKVRVSCTSAGNCTAGWGKFVATERKGRWSKPAVLPGLAALGTNLAIESVSCTAAVNCVVGGTYHGHHFGKEVFVASKRNGHWGKPTELPGFTALNQEGAGDLSAVSCISAGNCVAGGSYAVPADFAGGSFAPFVASERNGHWGTAIEVPGIPPADSSQCEPDSSSCVAGHVLAVSCVPSGTCAIGGVYDTPAISAEVAFVATYKNGSWTDVTQPAGFAALDTGKFSAVSSVSCTRAGKCLAAGGYTSTDLQIGRPAFVAEAVNGTWGPAQTVRIGS